MCLSFASARRISRGCLHGLGLGHGARSARQDWVARMGQGNRHYEPPGYPRIQAGGKGDTHKETIVRVQPVANVAAEPFDVGGRIEQTYAGAAIVTSATPTAGDSSRRCGGGESQPRLGRRP